ncbi:hypothetical protein ACQ4PT_069710 [Festuca glaucescens]
MAIECLVLGAGQEVGKSCVVVTIGGKRVMFDCGMHMGHHDCQRYPDFARILAAAPGAADFTSAISCVVITHFHLDHIGALPYFTEVCGYNGLIYMTVHKCVSGGGKVLIPAFALGRAQELCILLDDYWERMNLKIPIYFSAGLTIQANMYYKMLIGWTSQKIKDSYTIHNPFDFKHGFLILQFATLSVHSLMILDPVYFLLHLIHQLSFSPHTDSKGIMDLTEFLSPNHVILVHGEKPQMAFLKDRIESELGMPCYYPANNETVSIPTTQNLKINATEKFLTSCTSAQARDGLQEPNLICGNHLSGVDGEQKLAVGILLMEKSRAPKLLCEDELLQLLGTERHSVQFEPLLSSRIEEAQTAIVDDVASE